MQDLIKANEVVDEVKQYEDFTLTCRVLDLNSCGLIRVSDARLGGVDRFGCPPDQDSKTVKIYPQAGVGIFMGEKPLVTCLSAILARSLGCVVQSCLQTPEVWACKWIGCCSTRTCFRKSIAEGEHLHRRICT